MTKKWTIGLCAAAAVLAGGVLAYAQGQIIVTTLTGTELFSVRTAGPQSAAISAANLRSYVNGASGGAGAFTTLSASGAVSGAGFTARFATPGPIGNTVASTGAFTTLSNSTAAGLTVAVSTDSTHTTATLCEDTTSHVVYFGSGAAGICAGTSSLRFKHDVAPLDAGLKQVLALEPISYKLNADHGDANHTLYGFSAEQGGTVLPKLMGKDAMGKPNTFDYLGVVPVLVKAVQEQQAEIEHLKHQLALRRAQ